MIPTDIPCMKVIKKARGLIGCPADAVKEVVELSDYIARHNGGNGAVRDFIEWLVISNNSKVQVAK